MAYRNLQTFFYLSTFFPPFWSRSSLETHKFIGEKVCNALEAKRIKVFLKSSGQLLHWEKGMQALLFFFFFKEAFDMVSVALRPSLSNSSNLKCLREFPTEVREFVGNVEILWFAHRAIFEFWSSGGLLFLFCPFPFAF